MTFPTVVSYYTQHTGYEREVRNLIASCQALGLPYYVEGVPSFGSWERNCCYKPRYLLDKLAALRTPLLWVDADAVIVKKPHLFTSLDADIALRIVDTLPATSSSKMISGTLFCNTTHATKQLLQEWEEECQRLLSERQGEVWDQVALRNVALRSKAKIASLPRAYYTIYDTMTPACQKEAIIIHYQASRIFKKEIDQLVIPFWNAATSSQEARRTFVSNLKGSSKDKKDRHESGCSREKKRDRRVGAQKEASEKGSKDHR